MMFAASPLCPIGLDHLREAASLRLDQHVGQQHRERLVADQLARAPDRVAEAERRLLARERGRARPPAALRPARRAPASCRAPRSVCSSSNCRSKWSSITPLLRPVTKMKCSMPGLARLVDDVLDQRPVDHRQHLLRHRLGGGQEAGAEAGDGENSLADRVHGACSWCGADVASGGGNARCVNNRETLSDAL